MKNALPSNNSDPISYIQSGPMKNMKSSDELLHMNN